MLLSAIHPSKFELSRKRPLSPSLNLHLDAGENKRCKRVAIMSSSFNMPPPTGRNVKGLSLTISPVKRSSLSVSIPSRSSPPSPTQSYCASPTTAASSPQTPLFIQTPCSSTKQDSVDTVSSNASYSGYASTLGRPAFTAKNSRRPSLLSLISHPPSAGYASGPTPPTPTVSLPSARCVSNPVRLGSYMEDGPRQIPYSDGPVEVVPGVWIGAEESASQLDLWAGSSSRVRVVNVAREVPRPDVTDKVEYLHLKWGHGESDLARLPPDAEMGATRRTVQEDAGFWDAIQWMEAGRRQAEPVLIHCQCGVSRSASLTIAYVMYLACQGAMPTLLGELDSMISCYNFVKSKSSCIGPNISLVQQLNTFASNLTTLLPPSPTNTAFSAPNPVASDQEWTQRRTEFEKAAQEESLRLDREMEERRARV